jgi:hypothetical protein
MTTVRTENGRRGEPGKMPSGDAQRTWFPEMIVRLRAEWHTGMSMPALIGLRNELDGALQRIRAGRNIQTPIITCSKCGLTGPAADPGVGPIRNRVEGSNPSAGKGMGSISQAISIGRRRKSHGRGSGKLPTLKIAGKNLPSHGHAENKCPSRLGVVFSNRPAEPNLLSSRLVWL